MAKNFIASKGCVYIPGGSRMTSGFYQLQPRIMSSDGTPIIITGVDSDEGDAVLPVATLDDKKYLYVMGEDFGNISVSGLSLLGQSEAQGMAFRAVRQYFSDHRSNKSEKPIIVSMPGRTTMAVYLTRIVIGSPDPEFNIQPFMFRGIVVTPKKR